MLGPTVWGQWTSSVKNHRVTAADVLGGMRKPLDSSQEQVRAAE